MYQCVISDRGSAVSVSVCCAFCQHRSALRQLILLRWQTVMEGGADSRPARPRHTDTLSRAHRVHRSDPDGRPETNTQTTHSSFRAVSTPLNWANLEWTQAQLKTSQLTESNSPHIFVGCSEVFGKAHEALDALTRRRPVFKSDLSCVCGQNTVWGTKFSRMFWLQIRPPAVSFIYHMLL